jgi:hypothetical protein
MDLAPVRGNVDDALLITKFVVRHSIICCHRYYAVLRSRFRN